MVVGSSTGFFKQLQISFGPLTKHILYNAFLEILEALDKSLLKYNSANVVLDIDVRRPLTALARPALTLNGKSCNLH